MLRTELWSTFYDLTKSYMLEQSTLSGIPTGQLEFRISQAKTFEHKHMFNRCSTGPSSPTCAQLCLLAWAPDQWSGNLKHTNTFLIYTEQVQHCLDLNIYVFLQSVLVTLNQSESMFYFLALQQLLVSYYEKVTI